MDSTKPHREKRRKNPPPKKKRDSPCWTIKHNQSTKTQPQSISEDPPLKGLPTLEGCEPQNGPQSRLDWKDVFYSRLVAFLAGCDIPMLELPQIVARKWLPQKQVGAPLWNLGCASPSTHHHCRTRPIGFVSQTACSSHSKHLGSKTFQ